MRTLRLRSIPRAALLPLFFAGILAACGGGTGAAIDPYPQTLLSVEPNYGTALGGTTITLRGTGFLDEFRTIRQIRFGETLADTWEIVDDETIVVESPPGVVGTTVVNLVGDNAPSDDGILLARGFSYLAAKLFLAEGSCAAQPRLFTVDLETGALRLVGSTGFAVAGMAMGPDGMLYAAEAVAPYRLIRIDPRSAVSDAYAFLRDVETHRSVELLDLAFVGGRLLGRSAANELVTVDLVLGKVTVLDGLGDVLPGSALTRAGPGGVFLAATGPADRLAVHDVLTGLTTPGAAFSALAELEAMAAQDGCVYGVSGSASGGGEAELLCVDPRTGEVTVAAALPAAICAVARGL